MAAAQVNQIPGVPAQLAPQPEKTELRAKVEEVASPAQLPFDPAALKAKYLAERDKRLRADAVDQYLFTDGELSRYLRDPWVEPGFTREPVDEDVEVVVIGGGFGAQLMAVRLIEEGITNVRIIEKAGDFGGTWYWNRYPGAQCDIESYIYMPLLEELGYMPTEKYAHAEELLNHSRTIAKKWDLYSKALFQTEVKAMRWDEKIQQWRVETSRNDNIRARYVIPAAGPLHRPKLPGVKGVDDYKGYSFHTCRWDYDYTGGDTNGNLHKLAGKRVGIIGTGATAVQIVPHVGEWAAETYVFQRTPSSIDVRGNRPTDSAWAKSLEPGWQRKRMDNFNIIVSGGPQPEDLVSDGWTDILRSLGSASAAAVAAQKAGVKPDPEKAMAMRQLADFKKMEGIRARASALVEDPATAESLKPWYNQFCKRPCFHDGYLQTFNRPNVHLIDTQGRGVDRVTPKGVAANGQEYELDCLIYATGFELATAWSHRSGMEVYGRGGVPTAEAWKEGHQTMHGWTSPGFPNCFWMSITQAALTPNFLHVTADQARHIAYVIGKCNREGVRTVEATTEAAQKWVDAIVESGKLRVNFSKDCTPGYYNNEGRPSEVARRNAGYGGGSPAFLKILEAWRAADKFEGLDVRKADGVAVQA